jgi:hypothetical protein
MTHASGPLTVRMGTSPTTWPPIVPCLSRTGGADWRLRSEAIRDIGRGTITGQDGGPGPMCSTDPGMDVGRATATGRTETRRRTSGLRLARACGPVTDIR